VITIPTYPKIETLVGRDDKFKIKMDGSTRRPEFAAVNSWLLTEKIDGTNIRVSLINHEGKIYVEYGGRTDRAILPSGLLEALKDRLCMTNLTETFSYISDNEGLVITLFGEGVGPKIQAGEYTDGYDFILFDVLVGKFWLDYDNVIDVARSLCLEHAPVLGRGICQSDVVPLLWANEQSVLAKSWGIERKSEGVIARTDPWLFNKHGQRVIWKLKLKDFREEEAEVWKSMAEERRFKATAAALQHMEKLRLEQRAA